MRKIRYYLFCIKWLYKNKDWKNTRQKYKKKKKDFKNSKWCK